MRDQAFAIFFTTLLALLTPRPTVAQQAPEDAEAAALSALIDGPPAPAAPAVINRDENGNATVRAIRVASPIVVDGRLDGVIGRSCRSAGSCRCCPATATRPRRRPRPG